MALAQLDLEGRDQVLERRRRSASNKLAQPRCNRTVRPSPDSNSYSTCEALMTSPHPSHGFPLPRPAHMRFGSSRDSSPLSTFAAIFLGASGGKGMVKA